MATTNVTVTNVWTKIAEDTAEYLLVSAPYSRYGTNHVTVEFAVTDADAAPSESLAGHALDGSDALTRGVIGPGFVWARALQDRNAGIVVSAA